MGKFKKLLSLVLVVALVSSINWAYFGELLSLTKAAAMECISGGSGAGAALENELKSLSVSKFFEFSADDFLADIWDKVTNDDGDSTERSTEDVAFDNTTEEASTEDDRDTDAWKYIDEYRSKTDGLEPLGDTIPTKGDKNGTVAFVEVNGNKIFGVNSSLQSETEKDLARKFFSEMKKAGYFENVDIYGRGNGQVFTHAEAYSLMKAYSIYGDDIGKIVTIYCDRATCSICQNNLQYFKNYLGLDKLIIKNKNGNIFEY